MGGPKRKRTEEDVTTSFWDPPQVADRGAYVVVKLKSGESLKSKGRFWNEACLRNVLGSDEKVAKVSYLRDGSMLVETKNAKQTKAFLGLKFFQNKEAFATLHPTLNRSFGIIAAYDLYDCSEEDILEWLKEYGVTAVKRINTKQDGQTVKTNLLKLTFNSHVLPKKIITDYEPSYHVRPYIPNPLQCYNCGRFGHVSERCRSGELCMTCGSAKHEGECGTKKCVNCGSEEHGARYKKCPKWELEKEICRVKVEQQISYPEARELVEKEREKVAGMTYAKAVVSTATTGTQTIDMGTQTDPVPHPSDDDGTDEPPSLQREMDTPDTPCVIEHSPGTDDTHRGDGNGADDDDGGANRDGQMDTGEVRGGKKDDPPDPLSESDLESSSQMHAQRKIYQPVQRGRPGLRTKPTPRQTTEGQSRPTGS